VVTGGTGEMIVGGKIANRQNLHDKDGIIPGNIGAADRRGQTFKVKAGDWLLIPPDTPHQPKPDVGGFSYMIMKINVGLSVELGSLTNQRVKALTRIRRKHPSASPQITLQKKQMPATDFDE